MMTQTLTKEVFGDENVLHYHIIARVHTDRKQNLTTVVDWGRH